MAARGTGPLVFVKDTRRRSQVFFQSVCPEKGAGAEEVVDFLDLLRDFDVALRAELLHNQAHGEELGQVIRGYRFAGGGVEHRGQGLRQVGQDIIPGRGHLAFFEIELGLIHGGLFPPLGIH
jgi:hypothetical protein